MFIVKIKKILCIVLVLFTNYFVCFAKPVTFYIKGLTSLHKEATPIQLEWNESLFCKENTNVYNHNIARLACALSDLSYEDVLANKNNALVLGYKELGVEEKNIQLCYDLNYADKTNDQCAFSFATKKIKSAKGTKDLVFIVIRGTPLGAEEWISNLNISDSTKDSSQVHEGFLTVAKDIEKQLDLFLTKNKIDYKESILLITGHSRGGAIANILSAYFCDSKKFNTQNIYSYTFASPNVTTREHVTDKQYSFIWNIVNAEDIVPTVPFNREKWSYKKYGNTLTLVNYWNVNQNYYNEKIYPRVNDFYKKLLGSDYSPFRTGPFVPIQTTAVFNSIYKDVNTYYSSFLSLRENAEKLLNKVFSKETKAKEKSKFSDKLFKTVDNKTDNFISYIKEAFIGMHANETYLSFLLALDEKEAFSTESSCQIILSGYDEGAILSKDGDVLLQFIDGKIIYSSIKLPIAGWNLGPNKIAIGFPQNIEVDFILTCNAIIPSKIPITIEHFNSAGVLLKSYKNQSLYPNKSLVYKFSVGKNSVLETKILAEEVVGKDARDLIKQTKIRQIPTRKLLPELSLDSKFNFRYGAHIEEKNLYGSILFGHNVFGLQNSFELSAGIGFQQMLVQSICLDTEAFLKCVFFVPENSDKYLDLNIVPSVRLSLSVKPLRRLKIFGAWVLDFDVQKGSIFSEQLSSEDDSLIHFTDNIVALPSLQFGLRF